MFGRNVASYKFALGRALLDLAPTPGQLVKLEDLAVPFSANLCTHLRNADKQGTFQGSRFLDACRKANEGKISQETLVSTTVLLGFKNVIDAFHVVGSREVPERFFLDERGLAGGIRITDAFGLLIQGKHVANLQQETEARWRLVETAWELGVARSMVAVDRDPATETLFSLDGARRRRPITGAREALSGYQKGHCFYCFRSLSLSGPEPPDVDHFFPHSLKQGDFGGPLDGVWNLVLSCPRCNRGIGGKSDRVPTLKLLERLSTRNEFLIESHHPLRETLLAQTGGDEASRRRFLNTRHREALSLLLHEWEASEVMTPLF